MCFRPASADDVMGPTKCPICGKMVFPVEGILPSKCPFCKTDFSGDNPPAIPPMPPGMPSAPGKPGE